MHTDDITVALVAYGTTTTGRLNIAMIPEFPVSIKEATISTNI